MEEKKGKGTEESKEGERKTYMVKGQGQDRGTIRWKDNQIKLDHFTILFSQRLSLYTPP